MMNKQIDAYKLIIEFMDLNLDHCQGTDGREAIQVIQDFPSSNRTEWISVKERLPEEKNEKYWICTDTGYQCECRWTNANPFWTHLETDWHWNVMDIPQYSEVVAWMPLPEPYDEEVE